MAEDPLLSFPVACFGIFLFLLICPCQFQVNTVVAALLWTAFFLFFAVSYRYRFLTAAKHASDNSLNGAGVTSKTFENSQCFRNHVTGSPDVGFIKDGFAGLWANPHCGFGGLKKNHLCYYFCNGQSLHPFPS